MFRLSITRIIALSLVAGGLAAAAPPAGAAEDPVIVFEGGGFGHGVGMSQYGALGRAEAGQTADEILAFYYDGTITEDRTAEIDALLPDGIRVRLSPVYQSFNRPDGVTVSTRGGELLTVEIGGQTFTDVGSSVYLEQAGQNAGSNNGITDATDDWYWILKVDGSDVDICTGCIASTATIRRPDGSIIDIVDDIGSQGAHDAGDLHLVGRDTASETTPDTVFVVLELPIEDYLQGIDEVPASWPAEALKAQAIAARSYAVGQATWRRADNWSFDVYDSVADQVYDGYEDENGTPIEHASRLAAVADTAGRVVVYEGDVVRTFYSSSNGGYTAASEDPFVTPEPFHIAKPDPFDSSALKTDGSPQNPFPFRDFVYTITDISNWLTDANLGVGTVKEITITGQPPSGRLNDAVVTIVGTDKTRENVDGWFFWDAIRDGCRDQVDCTDWPRSTFLRIKTFFDIQPTDYFYEPVLWMSELGLTEGITPTLFGPDLTSSRAEVATFIWRFWDEPAPIGPSGFDDVPIDKWYADAVAWMKENGITKGTTDTTFSPANPVTRAQFATFLWRLAGEPDVAPATQFTDVPLGVYYTVPVAWMLEWGITEGTSETTFSPDAPLKRAQIATFLWRLAGTPGAFAEGIVLPSTMRT